jgi:hypothetical protein
MTASVTVGANLEVGSWKRRSQNSPATCTDCRIHSANSPLAQKTFFISIFLYLDSHLQVALFAAYICKIRISTTTFPHRSFLYFDRNMGNLTDMAERILARAKKLDAHAEASGLPSTHFFYDTLGDLPASLEAERKALVDESQDLKRLALGPVGMLLETLFTVCEHQLTCLDSRVLT